MKKTSVLVKQVLMSTLTAGIFAFGFTACSDELDSEAMNNAVTPLELSSGCGLENLEQHSYAVPYMVSAKGDWKITFEFDGRQICYAHPSEGHGSQQVKICVLDNWTDERRSGEMTITDSEDPQHPQVISLGQKCNLDNRITRSANGSLITPGKGNRIYGVGYGYNMYKPLKEGVTLTPIVKMEAIKDANIFCTEGVSLNDHTIEATGSTFYEVTNNFTIQTSGSAKGHGFEGEVSAAFKCNDFSSNKHDYALCTVDVRKTNAAINEDMTNIRNKYMTEEAYNNINGLAVKSKSAKKGRETGAVAMYPSTPEGLYALVKDYGTHMLMRTEMGGRLTFASTVDVSEVKGSYDLSAFAKLSYENSSVKASAHIDDSLRISFNSNSKAIDTRVSAYGGSDDEAGKVTDGTKESIAAWKKSLNDIENCKVVGVAKVIPLWDLVNTTLPGGNERRQAIKDFIEHDLYNMMQAEESSQNYKCGSIARISIPAFPEARDTYSSTTLVNDVFMSGQHVARICNEYLPQLNKEERVTVVYPVIENNVKYNLGYFVGDANHAPCRVCCTDDNITFSKIDKEQAGAKKEVYLRGSSFYSQEKDATLLSIETMADTEVEAAYMKGINWNKDDGDFIYEYPMVKIFNRLWIRRWYNERLPYGNNGQSNGWYNNKTKFNKMKVNYWRPALWSDYQNLLDGLKDAGITLPATVMYNGDNASDLTGFGVERLGWRVNDKSNNAKNQMEYLSMGNTSGDGIGHVRIKTSGSVELVKNEFLGNWDMFIRLALPLSLQK